MKQKILKFKLLTLITLSLMYSCGSNDSNSIDDEIIEETSSLVGKWYLHSYYWEEYPECEKKSYVQFKENGTFERKDYFYGSYDGIEQCYLDSGFSGTYTYDSTTEKIYMYYFYVEGEESGKETDIFVNVRISSNILYVDFDESGDGYVDDSNVQYMK